MQRWVTPLGRFLNRQKPAVILGIGLAGMLIVGLLDFWTGYEFAFSLFYLFPIILVPWRVNKQAGMMASLLSAGIWSFANWLAGEKYASPFVAPFNTLIRLAFFIIVTVMLHNLRQSLEKERRLARTDPVTGVLNSRAFYEVAANRLERSKRKERPLTLAYIDLDNFKYINDRLGHLKGDEVLRAVAETLLKTLRSTDVIARLGGDEFIVLLPNSYPDAALHAIERVRLALGQRMQQDHRPVTFSIGLVTCDCSKCEQTLDTMIRAADDAMYVAKRKGKNTIDQNVLD
jgi:diguanylate cyclase (GGDEF)-like protein